MNKIRTAVVGAGKMGQIHAKVLSKLPQSSLVAIVDVQPDKAKKLAKEYKCAAFADAKELLGKVDAVTISAPTKSHLELAELFISNNIPILIEKPLAASAADGEKIVALAEKNNTVVAVGHSERCNPVVQAMKRLKIEPKFIEAVRISPYPFRSTDIGVVLDVMIHDIDIILASRQAYLSLDFLKKEGLVINTDPNKDVVKWVKQKQQEGNFDFAGINWPDLLHIEQLDIDDREPLRVEQEAFLNAVADKNNRPEVTAAEGLAALKCAEEILKSVKEHKWD
ncbi:MAG: Gfo/Idh/MocA family oxidoreductase [Phycisphaerae bacterium]|nr:Gfo/Idh/MocA family oxidoreductase [Phycisphaerae bacterium]